MTCIGIIMGSESDMETMKPAVDILQEAGIPFECTVVSAHRTPERLFKYAKTAAERGLKIIIAGAGGAAHLPGMIAGLTTLPVLGVPVQSKALNGMDSLLSIVQMPAGVPVATFAIGTAGARNAALFAIQILALSDDRLALLCKSHKNNIEAQALEQAGRVESIAGVPFHWEHKTK
jgi:5-(carboxyamino)imidazole ribonucleotide mutase